MIIHINTIFEIFFFFSLFNFLPGDYLKIVKSIEMVISFIAKLLNSSMASLPPYVSSIDSAIINRLNITDYKLNITKETFSYLLIP